jgi:hypothetical protein
MFKRKQRMGRDKKSRSNIYVSEMGGYLRGKVVQGKRGGAIKEGEEGVIKTREERSDQG